MQLYSPADGFTDLLKGEPDTLVARSATLSRQAQAIAEAAQALNDLASGQVAKAAVELRSRAAEVQTEMLHAQQRYEQTATALHTYGVRLGPIKSQAERDIPALEDAKARAGAAEWAVGDAQRRQIAERFIQSPEEVQERTADDLARAQRRSAAAQAEVDAIIRRLQAARADKEAIAKNAIAAIEAVISHGKDTLLDDISQFFDGVGDFFATIGKWISDVVKHVMDALDLIWRAIVIKIFVALVLSIAALVLGAALGSVGVIFFGPAGLIGGFVLGIGVVAVLAHVLLNRMLTDILRPGPRVTETCYQPERPSSLEHAFDEADEVDNLNNIEGAPDDAGTIRIEKVIGEDGIERARVVLPSTQDWQALAKLMSEEDRQTLFRLLQDSGASNDLDSNLALMMMPEFQTIYERAVFTALQQAGVDPGPDGTPVMLVGFSQGGIMATHLAANRQNAYNWDIVLAAGSPVDHLTEVVPPDTQVYSIQHEGDPVPHADGLIGEGLAEVLGWADGQQDTPTWDSIHATAVDDQGNPVVGADAHNAAYYNQSWKDYLNSGNISPEERKRLEQYFANGNTSTGTTHHTWSENEATEPHEDSGTCVSDGGGVGGTGGDGVDRVPAPEPQSVH